MHRLCKIGTLSLYLGSSLDDLLIQYLVAVGEVGHASAEDHRVLVHIHSNLSLLCHQFDDRLAVFGLLEDFVCFLELFQIFDLQEVVQADGGL